MTAISRCVWVVKVRSMMIIIASVLALNFLLMGCNSRPVVSSDVKADRVTSSDESASTKRARVRLELAVAYFSSGQVTTALDEVKLAIAADPTLFEAYNLRGLIYAALGDHAVAEDSFRRALVLNPRDGDSMHNLGWFLCQQRRYAEASASYAQALAVPQYPAVIRTMLAQGICEARDAKWDQAEKTLVRAYELDPGNPAIGVNLGEVFYQRGAYAKAQFHLRRVNSVAEQSSAQTLWLAARIEIKMGNVQGANEFGLQLRNRYPQSRESLAFDKGLFDE